jgi:hypothetical protein
MGITPTGRCIFLQLIFDAMANHGHCRSCYWWQMIEYYQDPKILNVGLCWMQSDKKHKIFHKTKEDSYCPDYSKAKKPNGQTLRFK